MAGIRARRVTVATAGTPEQLPRLPVPEYGSLLIKAMDSNTGDIRVGGSSAEILGGDYFTLAAGKAVTLKVFNADSVWIDTTVNAEGVEILVEGR